MAEVKEKYTCLYCQKKCKDRRCSKCGLANYCSKECQAIDWKERHKQDCKDIHSVKTTLRTWQKWEADVCQVSKDNLAKEGRIYPKESEVRGCLTTAFGLLNVFCPSAIDEINSQLPILFESDNVHELLQIIDLIPTDSIRSCGFIRSFYFFQILAMDKDEGVPNGHHVFVITQYGKKVPTYRLWQSFSEGENKLLYSLEDWFDETKVMEDVDPKLRKEMDNKDFTVSLLFPLLEMMRSPEIAIKIWHRLFGAKLSQCATDVRVRFWRCGGWAHPSLK